MSRPSPAPPRTGFAYLDTVLDVPAGEPRGVIAMAHRGGALHPAMIGLENTLTAFEQAASLGFHYLETDVHATRDGVLVAFHDDVLDRVTDHAGRLAELTWSEVSRARIGGVHPVPAMADLFEALPDARFNIDLKSASAVHPLVALIDRLDAHDRVCVGSFSGARMASFRTLTGGRVATSATPAEVALVKTAPVAVVRRKVRAAHGPAALQVPHRRGRLRVVTPSLVRRAHAAGLHVHVWTVDDAEEMLELLDLGVDGLITDRPDVLRDVLAARGQWREQT